MGRITAAATQRVACWKRDRTSEKRRIRWPATCRKFARSRRQPVGSKKSSDSQVIGLTDFAPKSGALFRPGVSVSLLDSAMARSHSGAQLPVLASANLGAKMNLLLQPWYLLLVLLSEWVRQQQEKVIEFQKAQIEILMKELGPQRIRLSDDQRRRLAVKGKVLGRKNLQELTTIVQADTILRWHRQLVV